MVQIRLETWEESFSFKVLELVYACMDMKTYFSNKSQVNKFRIKDLTSCKDISRGDEMEMYHPAGLVTNDSLYGPTVLIERWY